MTTNETAFSQAKAVIPGGVDSPVRAFGGVGGTPRFIASASGARVTDESLTGIFRAGADSVLTYWALEVARRTR